jgi:hypothetical protein
MEQHVNTYQGMNKDMAYDSIGEGLYIDAVDIRITTTNGESIGAFTNIQGNIEAFTIPIEGRFNNLGWSALNPEIIGYTTIRNRIILFVADAEEEKGWIYDLQYDPKTREILPGFPQLKYYSDRLYFSKDWPIEALGRYETDTIQRVYWTDYNNFFRTINLEATNLETLPVGQIDIFPDLSYTQPILEVVAGGGALMSGEYQVAYRLLTLDGKETLISPPSNLVHVTSDSETLVQSAQYNGDLIAVNTFKSLSFKVDTSSYGDFDKIEFIVTYHSGLNSIPVVTSVEKISIAGQSTITFVYTGTEGSSFPIELLTYTTKNHAFKTPKTITQKDSSLVIANIKGSTIALSSLLDGGTFDARTARYNSIADGINLPHPLTGTPEQIEEKKLLNAFNTTADPSYGIDELGYNSDAHWNEDWQTNKQFRYQLDGETLGGEGPNISYKFHLEKFTMDGSSDAGIAKVANIPFGFPYDNHDLGDGYVYTNTTYPNHASPFISGLLRGYKRGETYRFGIIFYTLKGEATYVEYIGDIKFPDISEEDSASNSSGTAFWPTAQKDPGNDITWGFSMGIEFTIDFSSCPELLDNIEGYQIVRVQRTNSDKRRLTQGIVKGFFHHPIQAPTFDFDLRGPGDSSDVLLNYFGWPNGFATEQPNASFFTIHSTDGTLGAPASVGNYEILGEYLGFYSSELSFNYNNTRSLAASLGGNPCLLITGAYNSYFEDNTAYPGVDRTAQGLGEYDYDLRTQFRNVNAVTFNSIHNIKKLVNSQFMVMEDTADYAAKITSNFGGYYLRNYWCLDDWRRAVAQGGGSPDLSVNPNNPTGTGSDNQFCTFYKSGSNLMTQISRINIDFLTNVPVPTLPTYDYFYTYNLGGSDSAGEFISVKDNLGNISNSLFGASFPIIDLVLPKLEIYGGFSRDALETNIFIQASPVISKTNIVGTSDTFRVFGGDTFVNMFTLQTGMTEFNTEFYGNQKYGEDNTKTEVYPVESTINLDLACGASLRTGALYEFASLTLPEFRQEVNNFDSDYGKSLDMYAYNGAYSRENQDVTFFVEPLNSSLSLVNDIRAFLSDVKYNGEVIDSWTKFGVNNFYDVDDYGPINKILNWKDIVYYVQDRGIGAYAINRAAITTTADGVPTSLGTGQGFGKHQYFSKEHGCIHQWGLRATDTAIYFFDAINRKIFMFRTQQGQGDAAPLSEVKGMHSFLQNLPANIYKTKINGGTAINGGDNPIRSRGVTVAKDKINDEVYFTFVGVKPILILAPDTFYEFGDIVQAGDNFYEVTNEEGFMAGPTRPQALNDLQENSEEIDEPTEKNQTLVFDELAQAFSSLYSATPKLYLENGDILLSADPRFPTNVYTHNIGNWGSFYGNVEECSMTLVLNAKADINKILRTFEFNSIVRDADKVPDRTKTITAFQVTTQYQDTGKVLFSEDRIKRKFDKWRVKIPRNTLSATQQDRLRSTYFILTLYFDNQENKELIMNRLVSYFDFQMF